MKRTINGRQALRPPQPHPNPLHWEALRARKLAEQNNCCATCPNDIASGYRLELHHRHYDNWGNEKPEDVVLLCVVCHDYITSRFRYTDEYVIEAGTQPPPRPGLPPVEITESTALTSAAQPARPGLPSIEPQATEIPAPVEPPKRIRPF